MRGPGRRGILYGTLSACMGLGGIMSQTRCAGAGCSMCFGCAWAGIFVVFVAVITGRKRKDQGKEEDHGMA
jgi:hypothetical protein